MDPFAFNDKNTKYDIGREYFDRTDNNVEVYIHYFNINCASFPVHLQWEHTPFGFMLITSHQTYWLVLFDHEQKRYFKVYV